MPTTTPNFGWSVPVSTDFVKDGATAIELLGDSIDASLVDLKGGTTGQVLAKASATDLDFSWVAQDDSNAIQNAIIDAKGDLIGATAADTPARLAVGTNGQVLTADSAAATGLKWDTPSPAGLTLITTATLSSTTSLSIDNCFSSAYRSYLYVMNVVSAGGTIAFKLRSSGTDASTNYNIQEMSASNTTIGGGRTVGGTSFYINTGSTGNQCFSQVSISKPFEATETNFLNIGTKNGSLVETITTTGNHTTASSYDGITTSCFFAMTGTISIYGLAK
jgi:hypothetical protein